MAMSMIAGSLLFGAAACGSDDSSEGDAATIDDPGTSSADDGATVPAGDGTETTSADGGGEIDPCQFFTAEEMGTLLGFPVTSEDRETPQALGRECLYDSQENTTGVTVRPTTAEQYDQLKASAATLDIGGPTTELDGVGDEAYHNGSADSGNPSVALSAKKGSAGIEVELATAGDAIPDLETGLSIVTTVAKKALGE